MLFGGVVSVLLGIMIWRQFPLSGAYAIGVLVGIKLFFVISLLVIFPSENARTRSVQVWLEGDGHEQPGQHWEYKGHSQLSNAD
jgi:hypothetical protein